MVKVSGKTQVEVAELFKRRSVHYFPAGVRASSIGTQGVMASSCLLGSSMQTSGYTRICPVAFFAV
jgi:hypothetical protein